MNIRVNSNRMKFHNFIKATVSILYLKHILTYQYVKIYVANPNNILFLTIKSKQLLLFVWMLSRYFKLNSSHDALTTRDINRTKIVFIHDFNLVLHI